MASLELAGSLHGHIPPTVGYKSVSWLMAAFLAGYRSSLSLRSQWQFAAFVHWADPFAVSQQSQALIQDTGRLLR